MIDGMNGLYPYNGFLIFVIHPSKTGDEPYELIDNLGCMGDLWVFHYGRLMDEENHGFQWFSYISHYFSITVGFPMIWK